MTIELYRPYTLAEYVDRLPEFARTDYFGENPAVWAHVLRYLNDERLRYTGAAFSLDHPITFISDYQIPVSKAFVYTDPVYNWAVDSYSGNMRCPPCGREFLFDWTSGQMPDVNQWLLDQGCSFFTDTFLLNANGVLHPDALAPEERMLYAWIHSPVVDLAYPDFDAYLAGLTKRRRGNLRTAMRDFADARIQPENLTDDEVWGFVVPNFRIRRRYEHFGHAIRQFLIGHAAALEGMGQMFTVRDGDTGALMCAFYYVHTDDTAIYQGTVRDESRPMNNIGAATLAYAVQHYLGVEGIHRIDPTCVTQPFDPVHTIDTYKRVVVNKSNYYPVFAASAATEEVFPPYYNIASNEFVGDPAGDTIFSEDRFPEITE